MGPFIPSILPYYLPSSFAAWNFETRIRWLVRDGSFRMKRRLIRNTADTRPRSDHKMLQIQMPLKRGIANIEIMTECEVSPLAQSSWFFFSFPPSPFQSRRIHSAGAVVPDAIRGETLSPPTVEDGVESAVPGGFCDSGRRFGAMIWSGTFFFEAEKFVSLKLICFIWSTRTWREQKQERKEV